MFENVFVVRREHAFDVSFANELSLMRRVDEESSNRMSELARGEKNKKSWGQTATMNWNELGEDPCLFHFPQTKTINQKYCFFLCQNGLLLCFTGSRVQKVSTAVGAAGDRPFHPVLKWGLFGLEAAEGKTRRGEHQLKPIPHLLLP